MEKTRRALHRIKNDAIRVQTDAYNLGGVILSRIGQSERADGVDLSVNSTRPLVGHRPRRSATIDSILFGMQICTIANER